MNVYEILENVKAFAKWPFKIGFVGNGEPFLDWPLLKSYIEFVSDCSFISAYTITNGTISLPDSEWSFLGDHKINVGFSIDGYKELHNRHRCNSFDAAMKNVETFKRVNGYYPTFNATVGKDSIADAQKVIDFFARFETRVTFSRMIGKSGITLEEYRDFLKEAEKALVIRKGGLDCTMYGGQCGAGINNFFFANGKVYLCGNCIDLPPLANSSISFNELENKKLDFDRKHCFKESLCV